MELVLSHMESEVSDSDILHIDDKKSHQSETFSFQFYTRCRYSRPLCTSKKIEMFEDIDGLHVKERLLRNLKKMESREKELFSVFHQYHGE